MAVGLKIASKITSVPGIKLAVAKAGIKYNNKNDVTLIAINAEAHCAAVFTQNKFCAAPVIVAKKHLSEAQPKYLLINTGNANAGTGDDGIARAEKSCHALAELTGVSANSVLPFSTGVIGMTLPDDKIIAVLPAMVDALQENAWLDAASAIMTTDTMPKAYSKTLVLNGENIVITGIAKGAGMIKPNMATLLAYVATNANIEKPLLQMMLETVVKPSFNSITVDSDTSTNDACILIATGKATLSINNLESHTAQVFMDGLREVFIFLAQALVRDAEGATKFIAVRVEQGRSEEECREVAYTIAHSPLVKTAFFASDPNWGRVLAAVGRAPVDDLDVQAISIYLGDVCIVESGGRAASYTEEQGLEVMRQDDVAVKVVLGRGEASATIWTSDLSYEYVKINAEYRT